MTKTHIITAVYDIKGESYSPPQLFKTKGEAIRAMEQAVSSEDSMLAKYPSDYVMKHIGDWDERTANMSVFDPVHLIAGDELLASQKKLEAVK